MTDQPSNNPATGLVVAAIDRQTILLDRIADNLQRRETPAPGLFRIPFATSVRLRPVNLYVMSIASLDVALVIGGATHSRWRVPTNTSVWPFPFTIARGQTVQLINIATGQPADLLDAFFSAYPDDIDK